MENLELFPNSPWILSLFTISFLAFSSFIGKTQIDKMQYNFIKIVPFIIAVIHSIIALFKRKFIITVDDYFVVFIFVI